MNQSRFALYTIVTNVVLCLTMLIFIEIGRRLGIRQLRRCGADARTGVGVVDGTVYGLLGLLLGFSFSGAANRFDQRRQFVADEVNALGTAWQRLDLLPTAEQGGVRESFRRYVDALIASYRNVAGPEGLWREPPALTRAQTDTWLDAIAATADGVASERILVLPALNEAFGAVERERLARRVHPPAIIFAMLAISALAAALFAGYGLAGGRSRNWMYYLGIAATVSVAAYVVIELEYPRLGLVRVDSMDEALVELRSTMR